MGHNHLGGPLAVPYIHVTPCCAPTYSHIHSFLRNPRWAREDPVRLMEKFPWHTFVSQQPFKKLFYTETFPIPPNSLYILPLPPPCLHPAQQGKHIVPGPFCVNGKGMELMCHCVNSHQWLTGVYNDRELVLSVSQDVTVGGGG